MNESWSQVIVLILGMFTIFAGNFGTILWFRKESRDDWIRCQNTIDAIQKEMNDFHKRLLKIEMRKK